MGGKIIQGLTGIRAYPLLEYDQCYRCHAAWGVGGIDAIGGRTQQQHPQALSADFLRQLGHRRDRIKEHIGSPDHPIAVFAKRRTAPFRG